MQRLKTAIDPRLKEAYGPEICWTWRLLLTGIGIAWEEVPLNDPQSDVAYVGDLEAAPSSRLCVRANRRFWQQRANLRLETIGRCDGWSYPIYRDEPHLSEFFHRATGALVCDRDIIFDVFWLATGQEERSWPQNRHGHYDLDGACPEWREVLHRAPASGLGTQLEKMFIELGFPPATPRWPHGKKAAVSVSHDVDYPEVVRWLEPLRILGRRGWSGLPAAAAVTAGKKHHWHFSSWVEMERRLNVRAAFYFASRRGSLLEYAAGTPRSRATAGD